MLSRDFLGPGWNLSVFSCKRRQRDTVRLVLLQGILGLAGEEQFFLVSLAEMFSLHTRFRDASC